MAVRIPEKVKIVVTLRELIEYLISNKEWVSKTDLLEKVLNEICFYIPEIIKQNKEGK